MDDLEKLKEKYPSIRALGSRFDLTRVDFSIDECTGLPFDDQPNEYLLDFEACVSNLDDAERPAGDHSYSNWFDLWDDIRKMDDQYRLKEKDLYWIPPPDLGNLSLISMSNYASTSSVVTSDGLSGGVNPTEILAGPELTDDSVDTIDAAEIPVEGNGSDLIDTWIELCKKDKEYMLGEQDLAWQPPPDLDDPSFVYVSKVARKTNVNPMGPELTADSIDRSDGNIEVDDVLMEDYFKDIYKYWFERYILFSKYDAGIKLDEESWYSVTPECIAKHHASRCGQGVVIDCFTGVGGNAIRFAPISTHMIAVDIDPKKIEYAKQNAAIYGVEDKIDFITGDCFILAKNLKADTVFLSCPWGGLEYALEEIFDLNTMLRPCDGQSLFNVAKSIAPRVVIFLPGNVDLGQLADLSLSASPPWTLEVEKNFVNGELKGITAYFTDPSLTLPEAKKKKPDRESG